jgi:F-box-like
MSIVILQASSHTASEVQDLPNEVLLQIFQHLGSCVTASSAQAVFSKLKRQKVRSTAVSEGVTLLVQQPTPSPLLVAAQVCKQWRRLIYNASIHEVRRSSNTCLAVTQFGILWSKWQRHEVERLRVVWSNYEVVNMIGSIKAESIIITVVLWPCMVWEAWVGSKNWFLLSARLYRTLYW